MITTVSADRLTLDRGGRTLLADLSFTLHAGEALALTGPNGAGKTSLLRALAGLLRPTSGSIAFEAGPTPLDPGEARADHLHWLGAPDGLKPARTAEAELRFWSEWCTGTSGQLLPPPKWGGTAAPAARVGLSGPPIDVEGHHRTTPPGASRHPPHFGGGRNEIDAALDQLGLAPHARTTVRRLSTGQRRRLAFARLLARPRALWLLDEPLAPLDAHWRARLGELMAAHLHAGGLIFAAVHDPLPIPVRALALAPGLE